MKLICDGDSWTFGSEIIDPSLPKEVRDWEAANDPYRKDRVWPSYLARLLDTRVDNLGYPADDNGTILNRTISHVSQLLSQGTKPEDMLVIVGWSSPERVFFWYDDTRLRHRFRLWPQNPHVDSLAQKRIWGLYTEFLWNAEDYIPRFVMNQLQLQDFLNARGIRWLAFNAFYQSPKENIDRWKSLDVRDEIARLHMDEYHWMPGPGEQGSRTLTRYDYGPVWDQIDPVRFYRKDQEVSTFKDFIDATVPADIRMCNWHPSPQSHEAWANELAKYLCENNLL